MRLLVILGGLLLSLLPLEAQAQALFYQARLQGGVASDATGVSPGAYDTKFYRGPDLQLAVPLDATITHAWLFVYGGPNGLSVSSSSDTPDQLKLAGVTLREGGATLEAELRNDEGRRVARVYNVLSWLEARSPVTSSPLKLSVEEQGRADTSDKSSVSIQGSQLVVLFTQADSPLRDVSIFYGYTPPPTSWLLDSLPYGSFMLEPYVTLSTTFVFNGACDQNGALSASGVLEPSPFDPLTLTSAAGGRDDGVYATNPSCSPKGEDTNSLITSGTFGFEQERALALDGDSVTYEPSGDRTDSRLSDELFRVPYDGLGQLLLSFDFVGEVVLNKGYLANVIVVAQFIDDDRDGIPNGQDLCPYAHDPEQLDRDEDGLGDLCDPCTDEDGDGSGASDLSIYASCPDDCDDLDPNLSPFGIEIPYNGIDEDCSGLDWVDLDADGFEANQVGGADCDDLDPSRFPTAPEKCDGLDQDCDRLIDEDFDRDRDGYADRRRCSIGTDCDDTRASIYPTAPELCDGRDNDCDLSVDEGLSQCSTGDADGDGYSPARGDCNDANSAIKPGATEVCDGLDNNCSGRADEPYDQDRDGSLDPITCPALGDDCNDRQALMNPSTAERCDGLDNDCDGFPDDGLVPECPTLDEDEDGYRPVDGDCDDLEPSTHPGALELCDAQDQDCDGQADEDFDQDEDGAFDPVACGVLGTDCDDLENGVYPGAPELCDGLDNNCDGSQDESFDLDQDGALDGTACELLGSDCNDLDPRVYPGAEELCSGEDEDCDGAVLAEEADADTDGWRICDGDCDDTRTEVAPALEELCDGLDNNCNGRIDEGYDADLDGVADPELCPDFGTDCDALDPATYPGAPERCDGRDQSCDGEIDESFDLDLDGQLDATSCGERGTDCNDLDPDTYEGAEEQCDGLDNDCDREIDEELYDCSTSDLDGDGQRPDEGDCDDFDPEVSSEAPELCDGIDNNCDQRIDEGYDVDGDGYLSSRDCALGDDCNDLLASVSPAAEEVCDGIDNDCDDQRDEGLDASCAAEDFDGDGFTPVNRDCNDSDPLIYPGAEEQCDGVDQNCDGLVDETFDADRDGYFQLSCPTGSDCDDERNQAYPGAEEVCNGLDDNCDEQVDEQFPEDCLTQDADGDGYRPVDGDCHDGDAQIYPHAPELCDGVDQDCDELRDEDFDVDEDGFTDLERCAEGTDCDDLNAATYPGAVELCDGIDNDCDYAIDETFDAACLTPEDFDADKDGYSIRRGDCRDWNAEVYPGAPEKCNGMDDDCDRLTDEDFDRDGDNVRDAGACPNDRFKDCDDTRADVSEREKEVCDDGVDNDCDGVVDPESLCFEVPTATPELVLIVTGAGGCNTVPHTVPYKVPGERGGGGAILLLLSTLTWLARRPKTTTGCRGEIHPCWDSLKGQSPFNIRRKPLFKRLL